ncbi:hypothetical protein K1719_028225 [Acacia pycnantha]|nr:hypothetical protein K1719_028225 [Acacia pycnantha]
MVFSAIHSLYLFLFSPTSFLILFVFLLKLSNASPSTPISTMDSSTTSADHSDELAYDLSPIMKVYKDGRIQRLAGEEVVPPGIDLITHVQSKDVVISENDGVSARIFLPKLAASDLKLPLLVYFHGGGFCIETPFSQNYHSYLNALTSQAGVIGVSVHYRRAPEHPLPTAHEDSWTAMKWISSHSAGNGPDEWLNRHADLGKVFLAGDSAGGNLAHHMAIRIGSEKPPGLKLEGIVLVHPYFWGAERIGSELNQAEGAAKADDLWRFTCPTTSGSDDPLVNPEKDPNLGKIDCKRVLVCVAEKDLLKDRGWYYKELLQRNGFSGDVEVMETKEEAHVFHMYKPSCENAVAMMSRIVAFMKQG